MAGKDTGEVRKRFFGNPEIAQRFMGPARLLLGQLKEDMAFNSLQQGVRRAVIRVNQRIEIGPELSKEGNVDIARRFVQILGTVAIVAYSSHGQSEVLIDARAIHTTEVVAEPKSKEGLYLPYVRILLTPAVDGPPSHAWQMFVVDKAAPYITDEQPNNFIHSTIVYVTQEETSDDYTYNRMTNGYGSGGTFQSYESVVFDTPPDSVATNLAISRNESDDDLDGDFHDNALYVFDPADPAHPGEVGELDEWVVVKLLGSVGGPGGIPDFKVIIDLGKPNTLRYEIPLHGAVMTSLYPGAGGGQFRGSPGAVMVNARQGIIFQTDDFVVPPQGNSNYGFNIEPLDAGDYEGTYTYHPDSPLAATQ